MIGKRLLLQVICVDGGPPTMHSNSKGGETPTLKETVGVHCTRVAPRVGHEYDYSQNGGIHALYHAYT